MRYTKEQHIENVKDLLAGDRTRCIGWIHFLNHPDALGNNMSVGHIILNNICPMCNSFIGEEVMPEEVCPMNRMGEDEALEIMEIKLKEILDAEEKEC